MGGASIVLPNFSFGFPPLAKHECHTYRFQFLIFLLSYEPGKNSMGPVFMVWEVMNLHDGKCFLL